ncbi:hypothetical protein NG796_22600 [Laspinema sp. A4]|uniref:hypothetical protein n=1 Tax=Laspinema sp. D2d TaxID=2953686 RepID=UPI0021BAB4C3|nr:hypothetical protein [Laspinema sp. D2d]MCT7986071.1 hypothetical protein [Laspinema sp. D2d]
MNKSKKRMLICTGVALLSGALGSFWGGQMRWLAHAQQCNTSDYVWLNTLCRVQHSPAMFKGGTAGLWTGTILGAFLAGIATRHPKGKSLSGSGNQELSASEGDRLELEGLTPEQLVQVRELITLLKTQPADLTPASGRPQAIASKPVSLMEFQQWLTALAQFQEISPLTPLQAQHLLHQLGFSDEAIAEAQASRSKPVERS